MTTKDFKEAYGVGWLKKWSKHKRDLKRKDFKETFGVEWKKEWRKHIKETKALSGPCTDITSYSDEITKMTEEVLHLIEGYDKELRSFNGHHVDHKISRSFGFSNGIPPQDIAHISNLRFVPKAENCKKGKGNIIDEGNEWILIGNKLR